MDVKINVRYDVHCPNQKNVWNSCATCVHQNCSWICYARVATRRTDSISNEIFLNCSIKGGGRGVDTRTKFSPKWFPVVRQGWALIATITNRGGKCRTWNREGQKVDERARYKVVCAYNNAVTITSIQRDRRKIALGRIERAVERTGPLEVMGRNNRCGQGIASYVFTCMTCCSFADERVS
jgi:hypothetical protein